MSLEWSTLNECFSSPLQNSPVLNNKKTEWSDFDNNTDYNHTMSLPYDNNEQPNVALAEDAFRQVVNHESQHLYQQQQNVNALPAPTLQSLQPMPQEQSFGYNQNIQQEQSYQTQPTQHIQPMPQEHSFGYNQNIQQEQLYQTQPSQHIQPLPQEQSFGYQPNLPSEMGQPTNIPNLDTNTKSDDIRSQIKNINSQPTMTPTSQPLMYAIPPQRPTRQSRPQRPTFQPSRNIVNTSYNINRNIRSNLYHLPRSNKDEENSWLTILIVFIASFLLLSCK